MHKIYQKMYSTSKNRSAGVLSTFFRTVVMGGSSYLPGFKRAGFTLIELLVVVLIIGILAAVALPQYRLAVEKSRAVQAITFLKAWKDAEEIYYMTNGMYTEEFEPLGMVLPQNIDEFFIFNNMQEAASGRFALQHREHNYILIYSGDYRTTSADIPPEVLNGALYCYSLQADDTGKRLCRALGVRVSDSYPEIYLL